MSNILDTVKKWLGINPRKQKVRTIIVPEKKRLPIDLHHVADRGKEDPHTKIKRKMADRSRKINRGNK